jgi:hypothetical protein
VACETIFQALAPSRPIARGVRSEKPPSSRRVPTNMDAAQKVRFALEQALATPEVREKLEANGAAVVPSTSEEFAQRARAEIALTERLMKVASIEAQ